jgi:hypothetical protein
MANHASNRRGRRAGVPRCLDCGALVANASIVRCGFCARQHSNRSTPQ